MSPKAPSFPDRRVGRLCLAFLLLGLAARTVRWAMGFPLWGDEAFLALNLLERGLGDSAQPLHTDQVAPPGFVTLAVLSLRLLGESDRALRVLPYVAGVLALFPYTIAARRLSSLVSTDRQRTLVLCVAWLAVSYFAIRYGAELKPYTFDLLAACTLLMSGFGVLTAADDNQRVRRLALFSGLATVAVWCSFPVVFLIAGWGTTFLVASRGAQGPRSRQVLLAGIAPLVSWVILYVTVITPQLAASSGEGTFLRTFWADAFPPDDLAAWPGWWLQTHTGVLFAYPNGGRNGASTITFLLVVSGVVALWRRRDEERVRAPTTVLLTALLGPFAYNLIAAMFERYPYGGHPRLTLHLAPIVCLLAGAGAAWLIGRAPKPRVLFAIGLTLLALLGVGSIVRDLAVPRRFEPHLETRAAAAEVAARAGPTGRVVSLDAPEALSAHGGAGALWWWYLQAAAGDRLQTAADSSAAAPLERPLVAVAFSVGTQASSRAQALLWRDGPGRAISPPPPQEDTLRFGADLYATILEYAPATAPADER